jgi:hypothetical protein
MEAYVPQNTGKRVMRVYLCVYYIWKYVGMRTSKLKMRTETSYPLLIQTGKEKTEFHESRTPMAPSLGLQRET